MHCKTWLVPVFCILSLPGFAQFREDLTAPQLQRLLPSVHDDTSQIRLYLDIGNAYVTRPGEIISDLDSGLYFCRKAEALSRVTSNPKWLGLSCLLYSKALREKKDTAAGRGYDQQAIDFFEKNHLPELCGDALQEMTGYYNLNDSIGIANNARFLELAAARYKQAGNKLKQALTLEHLGDYYQIMPDYEKAMSILQQSLSLYMQCHEQKLEGIYDLLGSVSRELNNGEDAIKYGLLALQAAENLKDSGDSKITILNRLGLNYYYLNKMTEAAIYFKQALKLAEKNRNEEGIVAATSNLSSVLRNLLKPQEALVVLLNAKKIVSSSYLKSHFNYVRSLCLTYLRLDNIILGEKYFKMLQLLSKSNNLTIDDKVNGAFIEFYIKKKDYNKTQELVNKRKTYETGKFYTAMIYLWQYRIDTVRKDYKKALASYLVYRQITDSLLNEKQNKQIDELRLKYEADKKDKDIQLQGKSIQLMKKEGDLRNAELVQARSFRNLIGVGAAALLVVLFLLYSRYLMKQRTNRALTTQKDEIDQQNQVLQTTVKEKDKLIDEKEWLVREIHHRVKNNLQTIISLLESQSEYLQSDALDAVKDSRNRIFAMSLIHQKLYQHEGIASIDLSAYIPDLIKNLRDSFNLKQTISFQLDIMPMEIDVCQAIPIGLILNEAIINAIKHAFKKENENKKVIIAIRHTNTNLIELRIADNGTGLPGDFNSNDTNGLGMKLMRGLTDDIEGEFLAFNDSGTTILVQFVPHPVLQGPFETNYRNEEAK